MRIDTGRYEPATPWDDPQWRDDALAWAEEGLAAHGLEPADRDDYQVRLRPWSVVVRVPARDGRTAWFKANPPGSAFEPGLARALHAWAPDHVLAPLAVDTTRAWSLTPDGGPVLARVLDDDGPDPHYWEAPLRQYADLQRRVASKADELTALGVPDLRPAGLPERLDALLDRTGGMDGVAAVRPRFADWCAELADSGIPGTLDHADLHEGQVLTGAGTGDRVGSPGRYLFFDWGDASLSHPFTSLLVTARVTCERFGADSPAVLARLRDAYLEPWTGDSGHSLPGLRRLVGLACRVAPVGRALSWGRCFPGRGAEPEAVLADHVAHWLRELLAEPPL
jgi:hypothetical protein